ncbi:hypothetical protein [Streptodolium elevatio]|uniref:Uncharacterized protein n=1 Tax=Streptodolium elevatio TaxID=3157996 RepID=A0ABV3DTF0_9ACTN
MTTTYLLTPYATDRDAAAGAAPLPRIQVGDGILDVLAEVRTWFDRRAAAVVHVARDGVPVARITAADLATDTGVTFTRPGHADPSPQPAGNFAQAVLLAGAHLATATQARAAVQHAGAWLLSLDAGDFPGLADPADDKPPTAEWPDWGSWRHHPPAAYIDAVADSLSDAFDWTIADRFDHGFRIDLSPKTPEPHRSWHAMTDEDEWLAVFTPGRGWRYGVKFLRAGTAARAEREFPLPLPADPAHPGDVAVYLDLVLERGPLCPCGTLLSAGEHRYA